MGLQQQQQQQQLLLVLPPPPPPKNVKEKQTEEEKQEASVQPVRLCSGNENQSGLSESISEISVLLAALQLRSQTTHNNTTHL